MILNTTAGSAFTFTAGWEQYTMMAVYFIILIAIGVYAYNKSTSNLNEYMLGGRNIGPWVTALSAGASDMSGWMLMWVCPEVCTASVFQAFGLQSV